MLPPELVIHTVTVEDYEGTSGYGEDTYGAPYPVACLAEEQHRVVTDKDKREVVSNSAFYADPRPAPPELSRVTFPSGRVSYVITTTVFTEADGSDLPFHIAVFCK